MLAAYNVVVFVHARKNAPATITAFLSNRLQPVAKSIPGYNLVVVRAEDRAAARASAIAIVRKRLFDGDATVRVAGKGDGTC